MVFVFLGLSWTAFSQPKCAGFRVGKFQNIEEGIVKTKIVRNDTIQLEYYGDKEIKLRINWIDDCTYRLTFIEGNDAWWESRSRERPTPDLIVRITDTSEDSYSQEAKFEMDKEFKYKSNIQKVE